MIYVLQVEKHWLTSILYLEALKKNLSTKSTRLLIWRFSGGCSFRDLPKCSSFRPKCVHKYKSQLHQTLSDMIPAKHTADEDITH